jgi:hypothetical protein
MRPEGATEARAAEAELAWWPNCATPDCPNKRCLWSGTALCHQCAVHALGAGEMQLRYEETRG